VDAAQLNQSIPDELAGCIAEWLIAGKFNTLNVAGLREEKRPGIYAMVLSCLIAIRHPRRNRWNDSFPAAWQSSDYG
jgi:hypothetical protein